MDLDLSLNEEIDEVELKNVVNLIRPNFDISKVNFKMLTDGITNKLVLCTHGRNEGNKERFLIRIYGKKTDLLINRVAEIRNIKLLHEYGFGPELYGTFRNGLVYEFLDGATLNVENVQKKEIYELVAKKMALMHRNISNSENSGAELWEKLDKFFGLVPENAATSNCLSKKKLLEEILFLKELTKNELYEVVFSHNDLLLGNIILNERENEVFFIDFEYASFNFQPFDIANHFAEFAGVNDVDYSRFPTKKLQLNWLRIYLETFKNGGCTENEILKLYDQVQKFVLISHIFWYTWALIQAAYSDIDFNFNLYAQQRLDEYFRRKTEFLNI